MHDSEVLNVVNFKQASAILSDIISSFDIILLDLTLPDKQGNQLIVDMMNVAPNSPIIILTGFSDMDFAVQAISQGIEDYLLKDELSATILFKSISYAIERKKSKAELKDSENTAVRLKLYFFNGLCIALFLRANMLLFV